MKEIWITLRQLKNVSQCATFWSTWAVKRLVKTILPIKFPLALIKSKIKANEERAKIELQMKEMCMQPKEKGTCMNYETRFYFDTTLAKCMQFEYGGCDGNENNFESAEECESSCHSLIESAMVAKPMSIDMSLFFLSLLFLYISLFFNQFCIKKQNKKKCLYLSERQFVNYQSTKVLATHNWNVFTMTFIRRLVSLSFTQVSKYKK